MKIIIIIPLIFLFVFFGCSKKSTDPEPAPGDSQISVTGDLTESYKVRAFFGTSTYTSDMTEKEYFYWSKKDYDAGCHNQADLIMIL